MRVPSNSCAEPKSYRPWIPVARVGMISRYAAMINMIVAKKQVSERGVIYPRRGLEFCISRNVFSLFRLASLSQRNALIE
jgi:hypothetical protein